MKRATKVHQKQYNEIAALKVGDKDIRHNVRGSVFLRSYLSQKLSSGQDIC